MHGCDQDLRLLKNDFNFSVINLFDTSKAELLISNDNTKLAKSLAYLSRDLLNLNLDKSYQTSDW